MRIAVKTQLALLLIVSSTLGLAVLALAVWYTNHDFVLGVARESLEAAALHKAQDLALNLELFYISALYLTTSGPLQLALLRYNNGSGNSPANFDDASSNLEAALNEVGSLSHAPSIQTQLRARDTSGFAGTGSCMNVTGLRNDLGRLGYPQSLYPNLTIVPPPTPSAPYQATFDGATIGPRGNLVLGPLTINNTFSLMSMTIPVIENNSETNVLGWLTVVQDATLFEQVVDDNVGLGSSGETLLFGPVNPSNKFGPTGVGAQQSVRFLFPLGSRAASRRGSSTSTAAFEASSYPAVASAIADGFGTRTLGSNLRSHNEAGNEVSDAYSTIPTELVNWIVVVERSRGDVWAPVNHLRVIIVACFFAVMGFFLLISLPLSQWAVRPITRLRMATESTMDPLYGFSSTSLTNNQASDVQETEKTEATAKPGFFGLFWPWRRRKGDKSRLSSYDDGEKRFRIPSKVDVSKHWIKDDISDLMETFNEMSDELLMQYSKLERRVQQRTAELDQSRKAAEAANESKTLFVANVSHELRTPLNGVLGMCAVCIEEDDLQQIKQSLGIIHSSGELLLRTLTDLLTFSTNQAGLHQLVLEEREFTIQDLEVQVLTSFQMPARDKNIKLSVQYDSQANSTPPQLKDMTLWGDVHRILQILINLISNSLKHTPPGGTVTLSIRRSNELAPRRLPFAQEQTSMHSALSGRSRGSASRRNRRTSTANFINPNESAQLAERLNVPTGEDAYFEFIVQDSGEGIREEMQEKIFEPFAQAHTGLDRKYSGTGLGLSICDQLCKLMKGEISLQSKLGEGSTFTVKLPLRYTMAKKRSEEGKEMRLHPISSVAGEDGVEASSEGAMTSGFESKKDQKDGDGAVVAVNSNRKPDGEEEAPTSTVKETAAPAEAIRQITPEPSPAKRTINTAATKDSKKHDFSEVRVLVAEDNKINQQVILRMLKTVQVLQVTIAEDGQLALDHIKAGGDDPPYDLIFMDIQMPNMDGITSARLIRESGFQKPIVALTAFAEKSNKEACEAHMNGFLAKPLKKAALLEVLQKFCGEEEKEQP